MRFGTSMLRGWKSAWLHRLAGMTLTLAGTAVLNIGGCKPPEFAQLIPGVTLDTVAEIRNNPDLDDPGKRQALEDLGIDDPQLVEVLLHGPLPIADTSSSNG